MARNAVLMLNTRSVLLKKWSAVAVLVTLVTRRKERHAVESCAARVMRSALRVNVCVRRRFVGQGPVLRVVRRNLNQKNRSVALGLITLNRSVMMHIPNVVQMVELAQDRKDVVVDIQTSVVVVEYKNVVQTQLGVMVIV
ncbi:MAG: hypothetical protein QF704_14250 [Anaerolineales bacterium]|nr:hypothetical protein [Anaerolineales bacterium]